jgi:hypothetical protein
MDDGTPQEPVTTAAKKTRPRHCGQVAATALHGFYETGARLWYLMGWSWGTATMSTRFFLTVCLAVATSIAARGEQLLKPMAGPGAGQPVDGLRASIAMVKTYFGPGESLLVVWQLTNEGTQTVELSLDKKRWFDHAFELRRDGNRIEALRASAKARPDARGSVVVLEPGQTTRQFIDLTTLDWTNPKWCEPYGSYEVSVIYTPKHLQSGWANFRVVPVTQNATVRPLPPITPQTERIRNLIAHLGSEEFATREQAYQQLLAIGQPALPLLEEIVATGGDTDAARRCQRLIAEIKARLNPPPPKPIPPRPDPPPDLEF